MPILFESSIVQLLFIVFINELVYTLQENALLVTNFCDQKLLITIVTNLDTNLKNKKLLVTKIVTIINKKL